MVYIYIYTHKFTCNTGDPCLIPGSGISLGEGNGNLLQYSCLGNPMDRGAWWATVHGVAKNQTQLKWLSTYSRTWRKDSKVCLRLGTWKWSTFLILRDYSHVIFSFWISFTKMCSKQLSILYNFSKFGILFVCALSLSHVQLFATLWTVVCQTPLSMWFSSQEYWSGVPFPPPGDLPKPGIQKSLLSPP